MALIGRAMFYDRALSASGKVSCASCHDPASHFGPRGDVPVFLGGPGLDRQGHRAIPTLTYLERQPPFSIGPDDPAAETAPQPVVAAAGPLPAKSAGGVGAPRMVPQGGLFWDGRADTLQQQASGPLYDPVEMASTPGKVIDRLRHAPYGPALAGIAGIPGQQSSRFLLSEALFALARYQVEESAFHPYSSKFDAWLEGKVRFSPLERKGYQLFNDPQKGNCAACHLDTMGPDRLPPLFTDHQYEALGAPRNPALIQNHDPSFHDLGVCTQQPGGEKAFAPYCGMFTTPTLRNVATRRVFFHNGVFHDLDKVVDFYALRDTDPARFYPKDAQGKIHVYDDLPDEYRANLDTTDAPLDRHPGDVPALDEDERHAIVAFLKTLTDGWSGEKKASGR
ncbi:cytochrome-c peroxidase [Gluconacetobacter tumulisoli]|uniref:Cytochrome-c peroxidase n=2 Tax=Gluconacetobacter tumulisoli TaxID=1286189 RepID=A0A7W4PP45_9PROT|nr:cytochrome c peroxidase [Gluconacetobacter tumulisoli]MBB2201446.1 cytochrome-c peroxidase [Gluconacetobacter tumulisoli]